MKNSFNSVRHRSSKAPFAFVRSGPKRIPPRLPAVEGRPISIRFRPELTAHRGKLLSRSSKGTAVLAGTFLMRREIVIDDDLLRTPRELDRIFVHEVFHFVWYRLGAPRRALYEEVLRAELRRGARGELGWSAESMKMALTAEDVALRTRKWRDYACESFCDTAGWAFGSSGRYPEMTLAPTFRERRRAWLEEHLLSRKTPLPI